LSWLELVAGLGLDFLDRAGDVGRHFDGGLVRFQFDDWLVDLDRVADLDQHLEDVALGDAVTEIRENEIGHV